MAKLLEWTRTGRVLHHNRPGARTGKLAVLVPDELVGETLVGAIPGVEQPAGVLVVAAGPERAFRDEHVKMVELLLEPFSAVLGERSAHSRTGDTSRSGGGGSTVAACRDWGAAT